MGTSLLVFEILWMIDIQVPIAMFLQTVVCLPAVRHDDCAQCYVFFDDRKQGCRITCLHHDEEGPLLPMPLNPTKHLQRYRISIMRVIMCAYVHACVCVHMHACAYAHSHNSIITQFLKLTQDPSTQWPWWCFCLPNFDSSISTICPLPPILSSLDRSQATQASWCS